MTTKPEPLVPVVFRRWLFHDGDVFALFPTLPFDLNGRVCTGYHHIGQHSGAYYPGCIAASRPARPEEYASLKTELEHIGYRLAVHKRATGAMHDERRREARKA